MESVNGGIKEFLNVIYDYGYGTGGSYGYGAGCDTGSGSGWGTGRGAGLGSSLGFGDGSGGGCDDGSGCGSGFGACSGFAGYGDGSGSGIKTFNGREVFIIDGVQTIIRAACGNVAKGMILNEDLTLLECYVVKQDDVFAHGETAEKAFESLREKLFEDMPEEERIKAFWAEHERGVKYPVRDFYDWHHRLTGSCEMGRDQFARNHGINIDRDELTVDEFIELTKDAYGGEIIKRLAKEG